MKINELVHQYIQLRDDLAEKRKEYNAFEDETKMQMASLEAQLLEISNETGADSFKTEFGTAFRTTKDYARIAPGAREQVDEYAMRTGNLQIWGYLSLLASLTSLSRRI